MANITRKTSIQIGYSGDPSGLSVSAYAYGIWTNEITNIPVSGGSLTDTPSFSSYNLSSYRSYDYPLYWYAGESRTVDSIKWLAWIITSKARTVKIYVNGTLYETMELKQASTNQITIEKTDGENVYLYLEFDGSGSTTDNPYPIDPSEQGGGGGSGNLEPEYLSDDDEYNQGLATVGSTNAYTIYSPTNSQLADIIKYLYNSSAWSAFKNISDSIGNFGGKLTDYMFSSFHIPFSIPADNRKTAYSINIGPFQATVESDYTNKFIGIYDFGEITVPAIYGNALDYKSEIQLWLPFISFVSLDAAAIVGKTLRLVYYVSITTGDLVAHIHVNGVDQYQFSGNCASEIPLSNDNTLSRAVNSIGNVISTAKTLRGG